MTEALTNPMSVDLRLWKEDFFTKKELSLIDANQKAIIFLLFMANLLFILLFWQYFLSYYLPYYNIHLQESEILSY